ESCHHVMSDLLFFTFRTLLLVIAISVSGSFARITSTSLLMVSTLASQYYPAGIHVDDNGTVVYSSRDGCTISRLPRGGSVSVIAGVTSVCGFKDDVGTAARFYYPCGIARISSLLYIADEYNNRIRVLDLTTYSVSTLTGSSPGSLDDPFPSALFYTPTDVHHFSTPAVSVIYILDYTNNAVRKADLRSKIVSTVATVTNPVFGCLNRNGTLLFLANDAQTIVRVDISGGTSVIIAGYAGSSGYQDNRGTMARFYDPRGVAFNADETAIYIGDWKNYRLRRIQLSNMSVTTVAGTGAISSINSLPRASTFQGFAQIIWYCDRLPTVCGIMAAEFAASGNIRWIPFTQGTVTTSSSI
ncbi:membrane-associated protein, putative, partial [Bodo saltans]